FPSPPTISAPFLTRSIMADSGKLYLPTLSTPLVGAQKVSSNYNGGMTVQSLDTLGERIRYARDAAKLTQMDVAKHFGISRVSVTQWESNTTKPDLDRIGELAALLNTSVEWLLKREGYPPLAVDKPAKKGKPTVIIPGNDLVGERDMPVYAAAMGGDGHLIVTFDAIDYYKRPA